jgi:hypothetical protein
VRYAWSYPPIYPLFAAEKLVAQVFAARRTLRIGDTPPFTLLNAAYPRPKPLLSRVRSIFAYGENGAPRRAALDSAAGRGENQAAG